MTAPSPYPRQDRHAQAAYWFVQLGKEDCSPATRKAFDVWLEASELNQKTYESIEAAWRDSSVLEASPAMDTVRRDALIESVRRQGFWQRHSRRLISGGGVAASLMLAAAIVLMVPMWSEVADPGVNIAQDGAISQPATDASAIRAVTTGIGERNSMPLADGSLMELNTSTAVRVAFTEARREIVLLRGQAVFSVSKDPDRPFVVIAGDRRVTATGTEFEVRVEDDDVEVTLLEGSVEVAPLRAPESGSAIPVAEQVIELAPGERLSAREGVTEQMSSEVLERALSWREGWLRFENDTLLDVIKEINRYSHQTFELESEDLGELRVSGSFRAGSVENFASAIVEIYPVETHRDPEQPTIIVIRWRS